MITQKKALYCRNLILSISGLIVFTAVSLMPAGSVNMSDNNTGVVFGSVVAPTGTSSSISVNMTDNNTGVVGWDGDKNAGIILRSGSIGIRHPNETYTKPMPMVGFGIYNDPSTMKWYLDSGYLPCYVSEWERSGCTIRIITFGDKVTIGGNDFVAAYSRVSINNHGTVSVTLDPAPFASPAPDGGGFVALNSIGNAVAAGATVNHDYVVRLDKFGNSYAWPSNSDLISQGTWDQRFAHMKNYWDSLLTKIAIINQLPDRRLINAYKSGYIFTNIVKDGYELKSGENMYDELGYAHDINGNISYFFAIGDYSQVRERLGTLATNNDNGYMDAIYAYSWPFAKYLQKTNDTTLVRNSFNTIKNVMHYIPGDCTGPNGILKKSWTVDNTQYWTCDGFAALNGLASYRYICDKLGQTTESTWAQAQFASVLSAYNTQLSSLGVNYLSARPDTALLASSLDLPGMYWNIFVFNGNLNGFILDNIDNTFQKFIAKSNTHNISWARSGWWCSSYNPQASGAALVGKKYRSEPIYEYQFLIDSAQSSPYCFLENPERPGTINWEGPHPTRGGGSCPEIWGTTNMNMLLIESVIAERSDGTVLIGRGLPKEWTVNGQTIDVSNYPIHANKRIGVTIEGISTNQLRFKFSGDIPSGNLVLNLPVFLDNNIGNATAGIINDTDGTITLPGSTREVTITTGAHM